jgi:hypothetical protein
MEIKIRPANSMPSQYLASGVSPSRSRRCSHHVIQITTAGADSETMVQPQNSFQGLAFELKLPGEHAGDKHRHVEIAAPTKL